MVLCVNYALSINASVEEQYENSSMITINSSECMHVLLLLVTLFAVHLECYIILPEVSAFI